MTWARDGADLQPHDDDYYTLPHAPPDAGFQLVEGPSFGYALREYRAMNVLGRVTMRPPDDDLLALFMPLDDRPRPSSDTAPVDA
jgi:hypothetical protein